VRWHLSAAISSAALLEAAPPSPAQSSTSGGGAARFDAVSETGHKDSDEFGDTSRRVKWREKMSGCEN
jgi:hypothetical protein